MNQEKGYLIVEPPIHEELNWDMDLIIKCLEVIRNLIPKKFVEFPESLEYDLLAMTNFTGSTYPVIGIYSRNKNDFKDIPDFNDLFDIIEKWIKEIGLEHIKREALKTKVISWESLKEMKTYPKRAL